MMNKGTFKQKKQKQRTMKWKGLGQTMAIGPHEGTLDVERFHFHIADRGSVWQEQSERLYRAPF